MIGLIFSSIFSITASVAKLAEQCDGKEEFGGEDYEVKPVKKISRSAGLEIPPADECFAEWPEPTLHDEGKEILFVGDIPGHNALFQLKIELTSGLLTVASIFEKCRHSHEIPLTGNHRKKFKKEFRNGTLVIRISRSP
jgi:HSP20 family molecular chaperone IbpA